MRWLILFHFFRGFFRSHRVLVWENAVLRYQLSIARRKRKRLIITNVDRLILIWLGKKITDLRKNLILIQPETVIRWHRHIFKRLYRLRFKHEEGGRPAIPEETKSLMRRLSEENIFWGAPRIHGELLKLGIRIAPSTAQKYMVLRDERPTPTWKTFVDNHLKEIVAVDFLAVPSVKFQML